MTPEKLSLEEVRRLYVMRHHLFKKAPKDLVKVVADCCGLQAQVPLTPPLSLWSRVEDFEQTMLDEALYRSKALVKTWVMRGTLHVIPSVDLPVYNRALRTMWFGQHDPSKYGPEWSMDDLRKRVHPRIREALAGKPLKRKDLSDKVVSLLNDKSKPYAQMFSAWGGVLKYTAYEGLTVHAQPCGNEACFARLDKWLPNINLNAIDEEEAKEKLLIKYLQGYGPASTQDFACWSGLMINDFKATTERLVGSLLDEVEIDGVKGRFLMLRQDIKTLDKIELDEKAPLRLLPKFDSFVLGHRDRTRIIRDEYKQKVFKPTTGDIAATVVVNGEIVGTWRHSKTKTMLTITVTPFKKLSKEEWSEVEENVKDLSQFFGLDKFKLAVFSQ